jgi:hypothetical protein
VKAQRVREHKPYLKCVSAPHNHMRLVQKCMWYNTTKQYQHTTARLPTHNIETEQLPASCISTIPTQGCLLKSARTSDNIMQGSSLATMTPCSTMPNPNHSKQLRQSSSSPPSTRDTTFSRYRDSLLRTPERQQHLGIRGTDDAALDVITNHSLALAPIHAYQSVTHHHPPVLYRQKPRSAVRHTKRECGWRQCRDLLRQHTNSNQ